MKNLVKQSYKKMIICGNYVNIITYEKPFFYNFNPLPNRAYFSQNKSRSDLSINRARQNLYKLCLANEKAKHLHLFITFTFAKNITDLKTANYEWKKFLNRAKYFFVFPMKYVVVPEFTKKGRVHYHALFFDFPFVKNLKNSLSDLWENGFIKIKPLKQVRNVSAYVSKYIRKGFIDNRLIDNKAYFSSRNLIRPVEYRNENDIDNYFNSVKMSFKSVRHYSITSGRYGVINYQQYKIKNECKN